MTVIFGDRETEWSADSLTLLRARYARPLEHSIPGLYPIPPIPCANPRCSNVRIRKRTRRGKFEGLRGAHDLCASCYDRWRRAEFPDTGPPDRMSDEERLERSRNAERKVPVPIRPRLQAGDYGYRPSVGTARIEEAA